MSLIYNSLKQHEKKADTVSQDNPIPQRIERVQEQTFSSKIIWVVLFSVSVALIVALMGLLVFGNLQTNDGRIESVDALPMAGEPIQSPLVDNQQNVMKAPQQDLSAVKTLAVNTEESKSDLVDTAKLDRDYSDNLIAAKTSILDPVKTEEDAVENTLEKPTSKPSRSASLELIKPVVVKPIKLATVSTKSTKPTEKVVPVAKQMTYSNSSMQSKPRSDQAFQVQKLPINSENQQSLSQEPKQASVVVKPKTTKVQSVAQINSVKSDSVENQTISQPVEKTSLDYLLTVKKTVVSIKQAINRKDETAAETYLNQLSELAGSDSVIFQRMQAFSSLKSRRYQQAASSYQKLLNQKPEDLEANMNFVIALSELGDKASAKSQLSRLDHLYPESKKVKQYKKMIQAKYGY